MGNSFGGASVVLLVVKAFSFLYDVATLPIYYLMQNPNRRRREMLEKKSYVVSRSENEIVYKSSLKHDSPLLRRMRSAGTDTMHKVYEFISSDEERMRKPLLGIRNVVKLTKVRDQKSGKMLTKKVLEEDYQWTTLRQAAEDAANFGRGFRELQVPAHSRVAIFAETRSEWLVAARGCFQHSMALATLYTNLGSEAIQHAINLTQTPAVITSQELLPKLAASLDQLPNVRLVVVFEDTYLDEEYPIPVDMKTLNQNISHNIQIISYKDVVNLGKNSDIGPVPPKPTDPAVIMFTSGSTGVPKGVVQLHSNIVATLENVIALLSATPILEDDTYIAFLPLAHILEFIMENCALLTGVKVGFSSPYTLMETSTSIMKGAKGDIALLKPTQMCAVPLVLDRIYKGIQSKIDGSGAVVSALFNHAVNYRINWEAKGYTTPLLDKYFFGAIRNLTGGRLRHVVSGGAPLSEATQEFIKHTLGVQVFIGYGLTETCGVATSNDFVDPVIGSVGGPMFEGLVKIQSWEEGNYTIGDSVGPRGEIHLGGRQVSDGYYKLPEKTAEEFYVDSNGTRWLKSGDIGQILPNGTLKLIDRKKDLVKLQHGEYVSLGKVESVLKLHPCVENICVVAHPTETFCVAVVVPSKPQLAKLAGVSPDELEACLEDRKVLDTLARDLLNFGPKKGLEKFEVPRKVALVLDDWTPDSGLVTAALKLRRKQVEEKYSGEIQRLYRGN